MTDRPGSPRGDRTEPFEGEVSREHAVIPPGGETLPRGRESGIVESGWHAVFRRFSAEAKSAPSLEALVEAIVRVAGEEIPSLDLEVRLSAARWSGERRTRAVLPIEIGGRILGEALFYDAVDPARRIRPLLDVFALAARALDRSDVERLEQQVRHSDRLATIGRIAAGVVHELNNPLSSIFAQAESLLRLGGGEARDRTEHERLRRILESAERVRKLTHDLTAYARPGTGDLERMTPESVVNQALAFCEHVLAETGVVVEKAFAPSTSRVLGVRGQLQQVLINLITNACHAMAGKASRLRIETRDVPQGRVEIRLVDEGPGVPVELRDAIFEPFVTTKGEGQGTGLGLSIVRNLVERHDGTVHVEGDVGTGATFVVSLPSA